VNVETVDVSTLKVKQLRKVLQDQYGDACKGCVEREDYIARINKHKAGEL
jgi:hypothetical protein